MPYPCGRVPQRPVGGRIDVDRKIVLADQGLAAWTGFRGRNLGLT